MVGLLPVHQISHLYGIPRSGEVGITRSIGQMRGKRHLAMQFYVYLLGNRAWQVQWGLGRV